MDRSAVIGVDVGTGSAKGVLVADDGTILRVATRWHTVDRPAPGHVEMDPRTWWEEVVSICRELTDGAEHPIRAVGVSGMGPCVLVTDEAGTPIRPAILYGIDTRATDQIARLTLDLCGADRILAECGSVLTTQAVGPKLAWIAEREPTAWTSARRLFALSSWLGWRLTGGYYLDQLAASQCTPMYDAAARDWHATWASALAGSIVLPPLVWPGDVIGIVSPAAAAETGLPPGVPVIAGTIDAWSEAVSVGAQRSGDLMLMYGTTMFLIHTTEVANTSPAIWGTTGALPGTRNLAAGMATSGAITSWLNDICGGPGFAQLTREAAAAGVGANGLLMLPYFAGERTPIADPHARGLVAGLSVASTRGDLYRAALEATAFGVRHNLETIEQAGGVIERTVAVGGGTQGGLWLQIVSDVTGRTQLIPEKTIGASYGAAFLAANAMEPFHIDDWNPVVATVLPNPATAASYERLFRLYLDLYPATLPVTHALSAGRLTGSEPSHPSSPHRAAVPWDR